MGAATTEGRRKGSPKLRLMPILGRIADGYRYDWKLLLGAGLLVFLPISAISALAPLDGYTIESWEGTSSFLTLALLAVQGAVSLLGAVFYSGVVAAGEEDRRRGTAHVIRHVARTVPYRNLFLADIALIVVLIAGFVALLVPGLLFLVWFALIAPLIEIERLGVRAAFRRSRALVRPHFWRVAAVVLPLVVLQSSLEEGGERFGHDMLGETYLGNLLGATVANLLGAPLYALAVLALYFEIVNRESDSAN